LCEYYFTPGFDPCVPFGAATVIDILGGFTPNDRRAWLTMLEYEGSGQQLASLAEIFHVFPGTPDFQIS